MRNSLLFTAMAAFLFLMPVFPGICETNGNHAQNSQSIVINEIMFNPDGNENAREFVELLNLSDFEISLEGWILGDGTGFDDIVPAENGGWIISAGAYCLIMDPDYFTAGEPYPGIPEGVSFFTVNGSALGSRGLSNSVPETVSIISAEGDTVSAVTYSIDNPAGYSWERISAAGSNDLSNFACSAGKEGTPGKENSVSRPVDKSAGVKIFVSPNPFMERTTVSCEFPFTYARLSLSIYDRRGRLVAKLCAGEESGSGWSKEWDGRRDGKKLPAGPYIINAEAVDRKTGKIISARKAIVIGTKL